MTVEQIETRRNVQRVLAWSGIAMISLWAFSWIALARFMPFPSPSLTPDEVVAFFREDTVAIQFGLFLTLVASALLVPFGAIVSAQIRRIEGYGSSVLATTQVASAALVSLEFIIPTMVWQTGLFRIHEAPDPLTIQMLYDMGWLMFVVVISTIEVQLLCVVIAVFTDRRATPVLPRWYGYFTLWVVIAIVPAGMVLFFKSGAASWNGLVGLYIPAIAFFVWNIVSTRVMLRAIDEQAREELPDAVRAAVVDDPAGEPVAA